MPTEPVTGSQQALATLWRTRDRFAATAGHERGVLRKWRWRVLALTLSGTVFSASADALLRLSQVCACGDLLTGLSRTTAIAGAALLGLAAFFGARLLTDDRTRRWTQSRAVAEALKSAGYRFATGTPPYDDSRAAARLLDHLENAGSADATTASASLVSGQKPPPLPMTAAEYIQQRVDDQTDFYRKAASAAAKSLQKYRHLSIALGALATVLPIVGTLTGRLGPASWAAVATTAATAVGSFVYAERFDYLVRSYSATADRLELIRARWFTSDGSRTDLQALVDAAETVMNTENSAWMVELSVKPGSSAVSRT